MRAIQTFKYEKACVLLGSQMEEETYYDQRANAYRVIRKVPTLLTNAKWIQTNISSSTYIKQFLAKIGTVIVGEFKNGLREFHGLN